MGLESHVDRVLADAGLDLSYTWFWSNGLNVIDEYMANRIIDVLDESGEFGPMRYNTKTRKIEFGEHYSFFKSTRQFKNYGNYAEAFRNFKTKE